MQQNPAPVEEKTPLVGKTPTPKRKGRPRKKVDSEKSAEGSPGITLRISTNKGTPKIITTNQNPPTQNKFKSPPPVRRSIGKPPNHGIAPSPRLDSIVDRLKKSSQIISPVYQSGLVSSTYTPTSNNVLSESSGNSPQVSRNVLNQLDGDNFSIVDVDTIVEDQPKVDDVAMEDVSMVTIPVSPPKNRAPGQPKIPKTQFTGKKVNLDGTFVLPPKKRKIKSPKPKKRSEPLRDDSSMETLGNFYKSPFPGNFGNFGGESPYGGSMDEVLERI